MDSEDVATATQTADQPKGSISWTRIIVEFTAIVFGVLLGLGLNEWRTSARDAQSIQDAEAAIVEELKANFSTLMAARNYHEAQYREAIRILATDSSDYFDYRGLSAPNTTRAALDAAIATGRFASIPGDNARQYMRLYNEIDEVRETERNYSRAVIGQRPESYEGFLGFAIMAFSDLLYAEDDALYKMAEPLGMAPPEGWWSIKPTIDSEYPDAFRKLTTGLDEMD
ncbi:MAG: hypothetical protein AAFP97_03510 [Pseudomonadota bacterium]